MAADVSVADPRLLYLTTFSLRKMPPSFQLKLFFFLNKETLARYTENVWGCSTSCPTFLTWWIIFDIKKKTSLTCWGWTPIQSHHWHWWVHMVQQLVNKSWWTSWWTQAECEDCVKPVLLDIHSNSDKDKEHFFLLDMQILACFVCAEIACLWKLKYNNSFQSKMINSQEGKFFWELQTLVVC